MKIQGQGRPARIVTVTVKCIGCNAERGVHVDEIPDNDLPMCNRCGNPMVATGAKTLATRPATSKTTKDSFHDLHQWTLHRDDGDYFECEICGEQRPRSSTFDPSRVDDLLA